MADPDLTVVDSQPLPDLSVVKSDPIDTTPHTGAIGRALSGFWEQVSPSNLVKSVDQAVYHPLDTASALLNAQGAEYTKAREAFKSGDYVTGARHALGYLLPIVGPAIDAQADKIQQGDVAGGLGGTVGLATTLAAPEAASRVAEAVPALRARANTALAQAMTPQAGPARAEAAITAQRIAPPLAAQGVTAFTRSGLSQVVDQGASDAAQGINRAEASVPKTTVYATSKVANKIQSMIDNLTSSGTGGQVVPTGYKEAVEALNQAKQEVQGLGSTVSIDNLTNMRQAWQATAARLKAYVKNPSKEIGGLAADAQAKSWADAADSVNDVIQQKAPQLGPAYQRWSLYRSAQKVLDAADLQDFLRSTGKTPVSGTVAGLIDRAFANRVPNLAWSKTLNTVASMIQRGNANAGVALLGNIARLSNPPAQATEDDQP